METAQNSQNCFYEKAMAAVADPYRMNIILQIRERGFMRCCDVVELTGLSQPTCSHHIKLLAESELIVCRKEGRNNFITLNKENFKNWENLLNIFLKHNFNAQKI